MGREDTAQRANAAWKKLLESYEDPGLDPAIDEALQAYMAKQAEDPARYLDD
jgi:trimethylamine--corrinoid protein Co-methyltransferase